MEEKTEHYTKVAKFDKDDQVMLEPTPGAQPAEKKIDETKMLPSEFIQGKSQTISFRDHYMPFRRVFVRRFKGVWIINVLVTLGCGIAYLLIDGKQLVYTLFIPLDIFLNIGRGVFYWYYYFLDKK